MSSVETNAAKVAAMMRAAGKQMEQVCYDSADQITDVAAESMQFYPDRVSSYIRTFDYQQNFNKSVTGSGLVATGSYTPLMPYAGYLRGNGVDGPAWMHVGFWEPKSAIVDTLNGGYAQDIVTENVTAMLVETVGA